MCAKEGSEMLRLIVLASIAAVMAGNSAVAQDFPTRTITILSPLTPGSDNDLFARTLAPGMSKVLGRPVLVENKVGASGTLAQEFLAKQAPADGYTLSLGWQSTSRVSLD